MDGYSVTEAASVLGVTTERVWELLARGVLAGAPDGETGMRVFLQPRPAPVMAGGSPSGPPPGPNGSDAHATAEASPFRELLSEYRNLTERYGQALLALGEARGEVASLRGRVELLEARMDLRLPGAPTASPAPSSWLGEPAILEPMGERAGAPAPAPGPMADVGAQVEVEVEAEAERRRRRRGRQHATDEIAQALARANDPSPAELPGGPEAAAALAALRTETAARDEPSQADAALPREVPAAAPIFDAEAETAWPAPAVQPMPPPPPAAGPITMPVDARALPDADLPPMEMPPAPSEPTSIPEDATALTEVADAPGSPDPPEPTVGGGAASPPVGVEPAEPAWDPARYTTSIGQPDWIPEEAPAPDAGSASASGPEADQPARQPMAPTQPIPSAGPAVPSSAPAGDDWPEFLEGWEPQEAVRGMETFGERWPAEDSAAVSPAEEVDPRGSAAAEPAAEMEVAPTDEEPDPGAAPPVGETPDAAKATPPDAPTGGTVLTTLHGGTSSPGSSRAYRRLRRIFPG